MAVLSFERGILDLIPAVELPGDVGYTLVSTAFDPFLVEREQEPPASNATAAPSPVRYEEAVPKRVDVVSGGGERCPMPSDMVIIVLWQLTFLLHYLGRLQTGT